MDWFKFYGKDWMSDIKIVKMSSEDKLCFITLLCLASASDEQGVIRDCDEDSLITMTRLNDSPYEDMSEAKRAKGVLQRLVKNKMITHDNGDVVTVLNFVKRQGKSLTGYERVKRHRERLKLAISKKNDNDDNGHDNAREDKIREDKINTGELLSKEEKQMYNYENIDESGNPITKKVRTKIDATTNKMLISVGLLWREMASNHLRIKKEDVVMLNLYYPIRERYDDEKFSYEDFKGLFHYFLNDNGMKEENKLSFDLCLSRKYVAKYKLAKRNKPKTNASLSSQMPL